MKLLIYDEEIAVYIQSQGYDVKNRFVSDHRIPAGKKIIKVAKDYIDDMIQIGLDYLDDPKIRKRIIESGVKIVAAVLRLPKPPKR